VEAYGSACVGLSESRVQSDRAAQPDGANYDRLTDRRTLQVIERDEFDAALAIDVAGAFRQVARLTGRNSMTGLQVIS
jgi:hypothetical protein